MAKLTNLIESIATKFAARKSIASEWNFAIVILMALKIGTNIVGIYAGYYYLLSVAYRVLPPLPAIIASLFFLALIEFLTVYVLIRAAKMIRTKQAKAGIYASLAALLLYSISFHFATSGLATHASMAQSKQTEIISIQSESEADTHQKIDNLKADLQAEKNDIRSNPQAWKHGKKIGLSDAQLTRIAEINTKLEALENQRLSELKELTEATSAKLKTDHIEMSENASKYWFFTAFIMAIQFAVTVALALLYVSIRKEIEPELMFQESVNDVKKQIAEANRSKLLQDYTQDAHYVILAMNTPYTSQKSTPQKQLKSSANIGFKIEKSNPLTDVQTDVNASSHIGNFGTGICQHCNVSFQKNSHNQKYCSELHRIEFYENKTGKKLTNLKAKHQ